MNLPIISLLVLLPIVLVGIVGIVLYQWMKQMNRIVNSLRTQNQDLLNRLMSKDVQAYSMMTALTTSSQISTFNDEYISQTDQAEVERLRNLSAGQGVGDTIYAEPDEDMSNFMQDMMGIIPDSPNG